MRSSFKPDTLAMAIADDDMKEDLVFPILLDSFNSNLGEDTLPLEDVAWVDSCLNPDIDASNNDWSSLKDVLLEILSSQSGSNDPSAAVKGAESIFDADSGFREYVTSLELGRGSQEDEDLVDDDVGDAESIDISDDEEDSLVLGSKKGRMRGKPSLENVFRPNYNEDFAKGESSTSATDPSLTTWEAEPSSGDIFRVWDLGISDEQDDFTKQLNKALVDNPPDTLPNIDESPIDKDVMQVSVDDLVAGFGDLSLKQHAN